jgi:hypothetical protein
MSKHRCDWRAGAQSGHITPIPRKPTVHQCQKKNTGKTAQYNESTKQMTTITAFDCFYDSPWATLGKRVLYWLLQPTEGDKHLPTFNVKYIGDPLQLSLWTYTNAENHPSQLHQHNDKHALAWKPMAWETTPIWIT